MNGFTPAVDVGFLCHTKLAGDTLVQDFTGWGLSQLIPLYLLRGKEVLTRPGVAGAVLQTSMGSVLVVAPQTPPPPSPSKGYKSPIRGDPNTL